MIAANPSGLAAAFEQTHSALFDLVSDAPSIKALAEYRERPVDFLVEKLGIPRYRVVWSLNAGYVNEHGVFQRLCPVCRGVPSDDPEQPCEVCAGFGTLGWDGTVDPLVVMLNALRDWKDCCVEAATGTQKSYTAACAVLWFLACWEGARAFTFAGSEEQLRNYMWKEIRELWPRFQALFPSAVLLDLRIRMRGGIDDSWGAVGVSVKRRAGEESAVGAQGMHAPHMLLVYEETPGIEWSVITAGQNTCTAPHNLRLALGNPDHQLDTLHRFGYDTHGRSRQNMVCVRISALDHPNVVCRDADIVPGAASLKSVEQRLSDADSGASDRMYQSRVRGISPSEAADALIKRAWIREAQRKWADKEARAILERVGFGKRALGVDVANSESGDEAAIARGLGAVLQEVDSFQCPDANNLGFKVFLEMEEHGILDEHVGVDGVGVGAGAVNKLREKERYIRDLQGGAKAEGSLDQEEWNNLRSQILWTFREDLRKGLVALPPDTDLENDLITPTWTTKSGKIVVESKEELKKRLGHSPNKGDAAAYWNFVRPRDPVAEPVKPKNVAPTIRERVMREIQALDEPQPAKRYFGTLRQG